MGTWRMGEQAVSKPDEIAALRRGMELGLTLIDTAEMYGEGGAETVVGEAMTSRRSDIFLVSKVYPHNASRKGVIAACDRTLKRLNTDYLDLYLLHWRSAVPLAETLETFQALKQAGKIRDYGVSNFDTDDMAKAAGLEGGESIATNQILYNLSRRGVELDLLPWCKQHRIPVMAYSPIEQGRLLNNPALKQLAQTHDATAAQIAIAWLLHQENIVVIPKASKIEHVEQNYAALDIALGPEELDALDSAFPRPSRPIPLEML
ncbi:aldo/keto reductase [cf. Phormidesmis sp. LEGE 11477]|nr:aldo/keto reductase [cf. Phormidesmis sp. LEGE 11477]MBE9059669.1 aldo/keto reductase [cf. Phormidesmis sp. LEGE 11477]